MRFPKNLPSFNFLKPKPPGEGPHFADIYPRAIAGAIDLILIFTLLNSTFQLMSTRIYAHVNKEILGDLNQAMTLGELAHRVWYSHLGVLWALNTAFQVIIIGILIVAVQILWGTTPGKWLMGLKIVHHRTLEPISSWRFILRFFAYIPALLPLMIGVFWLSFNKRRRGWHDYIAGTVVLDTRPTGWYWNKLKRFVKKLLGRDSGPVEQPVGEPPAEQRHQDGDKSVG